MTLAATQFTDLASSGKHPVSKSEKWFSVFVLFGLVLHSQKTILQKLHDYSGD